MNRYQVLVRTALIVYWLLLFTATHIPLKKGTLPPGTDVPLHFIAYAGLAFLLTWWLSIKWGHLSLKHLSFIFLGLSLFGLLDELLQGIPVLHRQPSVDDWVADTLGVFLGIVLFLAVQKPLQLFLKRFQKDETDKTASQQSD